MILDVYAVSIRLRDSTNVVGVDCRLSLPLVRLPTKVPVRCPWALTQSNACFAHAHTGIRHH